MSLRPYQRDALSSIVMAQMDGCHQQLIVLPTGCHAKGQELLMHNGSISRVEDIVPGDTLMGPDSKPRKVLSLCRGNGPMVRVAPRKGEPFVVNDHHIMTLVRTAQKSNARYKSQRGSAIIDVCLHEVMGWSKYNRHVHKLFRAAVDFPLSAKPLPIPPYILGALLGDGSIKRSVGLCCNEPETVKEFKDYTESLGLVLKTDGEGTSATLRVSSGGRNGGVENAFAAKLRGLGLFGKGSDDKFIPFPYKTSSRDDRLQLLAGLMDTDGTSERGRFFSITTKSPALADGIAFVARSLGFATYPRRCTKACQTGASGEYFRLGIAGDLAEIPCRVKRKKARPGRRRSWKDTLRTGFECTRLGVDDYYGFTLDGDGRYLLADFTVTHNTGKTRIASNLPETIGLSPFDVMAFVVGTEELAFQAVDDLRANNPELRVTLEKAEHYGDEDADIVVASIDTLSRSEPRLARFAALPLRIIFLDECHGAVSPKYIKVLKALKALKDEPDCDPGRLLIGLTATPRRFDGLALSRIFDRIVFRRGIREMIKAKWIVDPVGYRVEIEVDLDGVAMRNGDFATGELSLRMNQPAINELVVEKYREFGEGLPAIVFSVDIAHSEALAAEFRAGKLDFEAISSNTPKARRKELVEAHRKMWIRGLISCQALLTGFDSPPATVAMFARPTCSGLLYTQALGRVLRPYPAPEAASTHTGYFKTKAIVVDLVGVSSKLRLFTASTLFGLNPRFNMKGKPATKTLEDVEAILKRNPSLDVAAYDDLEEVESAASRVDLWKPAPIPKLAKHWSQFLWVEAGDNLYRLNAPGMAIFIEVNHLGDHEVYRRWYHLAAQDENREIFAEPEDAFAYADSLVPEEMVMLLRVKSRWRKDPPTEAQCDKLWVTDPAVRKSFSSGAAFYRFAENRFHQGNVSFSKGSISMRIDMAKTRSTVIGAGG